MFIVTGLSRPQFHSNVAERDQNMDVPTSSYICNDIYEREQTVNRVKRQEIVYTLM